MLCFKLLFCLIGSRSNGSYFQDCACMNTCLRSLYFWFVVLKLFMVRVVMFILMSMLYSPQMARIFWLIHVIVRALSGSYFIPI